MKAPMQKIRIVVGFTVGKRGKLTTDLLEDFVAVLLGGKTRTASADGVVDFNFKNAKVEIKDVAVIG